MAHVEDALSEAVGNLPPCPAGYVRVLWVVDTVGYVDVPLYPGMTYRELRLIVSKAKGWLPFSFGLSGADRVLPSLDDAVADVKHLFCCFVNGHGPYLKESHAVSIFIIMRYLTFPTRLVGRIIEVALAQLSLRRVSLLRQSAPLPSWGRTAFTMWQTEGPGSFLRFGAATTFLEALVVLANGILPPMPPLDHLKGNPVLASLSLASSHALRSAPEYLFRSILTLQYESTLAPTSTALQFYRFPLISLSLISAKLWRSTPMHSLAKCYFISYCSSSTRSLFARRSRHASQPGLTSLRSWLRLSSSSRS